MDRTFLDRALRLAARGRYTTSPNPLVGALVVRDGEVIAEGYHLRLGGPHAEAEALARAGDAARGADLYVTLEPCNHHGRTGPCSEAVLAAGVRRVVVCHRDPNPIARGGLDKLRQAGVEVLSGLRTRQAIRLNWRYLSATVQGRPAVTLKWAMSLDGKIATVTGESQWISSPEGRRWGLAQREEHDGIVVGIGTALADDPRLDRRLGKATRPNVRIVLDRRLRLPPAARMLDRPGDVLVYTEADAPAARAALEERGAEVIRLPRVEPPRVLADLGDRGLGSVLVEGGGEIEAAFAAAGCFDQLAVNLAPMLIAGRAAPGPVGGDGFPILAQAPRLEDLRAGRRGGDLILTAFRHGWTAAMESAVA